VGKYGSVDWREDCARCSNCVKPRCVFDAYRKEAAYNRDPSTSIVPLHECRACLSCAQGCTKGLLAISINPSTWPWATNTGSPTSWPPPGTRPTRAASRCLAPATAGASMALALIRSGPTCPRSCVPTRDGIHGREYISTSVDIGTKPMRLTFSSDGSLLGEPAKLIDLPLPLILDVPPWKVGAGSWHVSA